MKIQINPTTAINVSAITILLDKKEFHVQWKKLVPSTNPDDPAGTLLEEPEVNDTVEMIAFDSSFDTLTTKSFATMKSTVGATLITKYKDIL